jgi:hypothetical protein
MSVNALNQTVVQLTQINCGECGGTYAINERYREQQYQKGGTWTCPYCKVGWGYSHDNENSRLKGRLAEAEARERAERERKDRALSEANQLRYSLRSQKASTTRIRNRVAHDVCPCCTRSFTNLRRHMDTKHPEYVVTR